MLVALAAGADGRPKARTLLSRALAIAEELAAALREHPASIRVEIAGSARRMAETCKDLDLVATATDPEALAAAFSELPLLDEVQSTGAAGVKAITNNGMSVDLRDRPAGELRQPAPALHRLGQAQRGAADRRRAPRPARERVRRDRRRHGDHPRLRHRGGGLRAARDAVHRARAAREPRRDRGREGGQAAGADPRRGHPRRAAQPQHRVRRAQLDRADGPRRDRARLRVPGDHRPLGHSRVRQRRAAGRAAAPDRAHPRAERGPGRLHAARGHRGERAARTARSTTPTTCWSSSTGSWPACTPPSA